MNDLIFTMPDEITCTIMYARHHLDLYVLHLLKSSPLHIKSLKALLCMFLKMFEWFNPIAMQ